MIAVVDASVLLLLFDPNCGVPANADGHPIAGCKERVEHLIERLSKSGGRLVIPTPALAEILVNAGDAGPEWLARLHGRRSIRIEPFDERAAIECAAMARIRPATRGNAARTKAKFDEQIVAIARIHGATEIYSDDGDIKQLAGTDIAVIGIGELPLPPEDAQGSLGLTMPDHPA